MVKQYSNTPSAIRKRKWREERKDFYLKSGRERQWTLQGIDIEKANDLLKDNHTCDICEGSFDRLCIDHCHETKLIRGTLCHKCNRGLGFFNDNIKRLRKAADYLDQFNNSVYN